MPLEFGWIQVQQVVQPCAILMTKLSYYAPVFTTEPKKLFAAIEPDDGLCGRRGVIAGENNEICNGRSFHRCGARPLQFAPDGSRRGL